MKKATKNPKAQPPAESKSKHKEVKPAVPAEGQTPEDGRLDFGGLPDRDLKKNLGGCG